MAVPGSPLDPRSHGCNEMIREGAILIQCAQDIIELVSSFEGIARSHFHEEARSAPDEAAEVPPPPEPSGNEHAKLLALLGLAPVGVDEIVRQSGLGAAQVQMALVEMELAGAINRHAGGRVSRAV
jgi:DNA processing protein